MKIKNNDPNSKKKELILGRNNNESNFIFYLITYCTYIIMFGKFSFTLILILKVKGQRRR